MSAKPPKDLNIILPTINLEGHKSIHTTPSHLPKLPIIETTEDIIHMLDSRFIEILSSEHIGLEFNELRGCQSWSQLNLDIYEIVEMIMSIEKIYGVNIYDVAAEGFERASPNIIWQNITLKSRESKLGDLGI